MNVFYQKAVKKLSTFRRLSLARMQGLSFLKPNYIFFDVFDHSSVVIDVGCGFEAELATHFITQHNLHAYGVDPTQKHAPHLHQLAHRHKGRFEHINAALTGSNGTLTFHESMENESGSLFEDHANVRRDHISAYDVETLSLRGLLNRIEKDTVDFLKLDLEGAEYELLGAIKKEDLIHFKQIFIEFHHHCIESRTVQDTHILVQRLKAFGLSCLTIDDHNYLFFWDSPIAA